MGLDPHFFSNKGSPKPFPLIPLAAGNVHWLARPAGTALSLGSTVPGAVYAVFVMKSSPGLGELATKGASAPPPPRPLPQSQNAKVVTPTGLVSRFFCIQTQASSFKDGRDTTPFWHPYAPFCLCQVRLPDLMGPTLAPTQKCERRDPSSFALPSPNPPLKLS